MKRLLLSGDEGDCVEACGIDARCEMALALAGASLALSVSVVVSRSKVVDSLR